MFLLFLDMFQDSAPHSRVFKGPEIYTHYLTDLYTSLQLKKCFMMPIWEEAWLIFASILSSSVRSELIIDPRYLKVLVKWMLLVPVFNMISGKSIELCSFCFH